MCSICKGVLCLATHLDLLFCLTAHTNTPHPATQPGYPCVCVCMCMCVCVCVCVCVIYLLTHCCLPSYQARHASPTLIVAFVDQNKMHPLVLHASNYSVVCSCPLFICPTIVLLSIYPVFPPPPPPPFPCSDTICDLGFSSELANYGEYSGAPTESQTYEYAKTLLNLMTRTKHPDGQLLAADYTHFPAISLMFCVFTSLRLHQLLVVWFCVG